MILPPTLVVAAPLRGPAGARVAPLLAAIERLCPVRFLVAPSEADLAPGPRVSMAEWLDDRSMDRVPHLHILVDDEASALPFRAAMCRPGVTVLEDPGLARLQQAITLDAGQPAAWLRLLAQHHGAGARRLGRAQLGGLFAPAQRQRMPMLDGIAEAASLLVVRSRHALGFLPPGARAVALPPPFADPAAMPAPASGRRLLLPLRDPISCRALAPLQAAATTAGAELLPWICDLAPMPAADAALALHLPFGATPLHGVMAAMARGLPVLAWAEDPAAEWPEPAVSRIGFGAAPEALAAAFTTLLDQAAPRGEAALHLAASHGADAAALALLHLVPGCRVAAPAP